MNIRRMITAAVESFDSALGYAARRLHILVTVEAYLIARGVGEAARKRWGTRFGTMANRERKAAGETVARLWATCADGKTWRVYGYAPDRVRHLDAAWAHYADKIMEG